MQFSHAPGTQVLDRYTIRRGIGIGGFGEVYFAVSDGGKEVALKQVQRNWEVELRGARHCLNLKHQNLVSLHDVAQDGDERWWVVMEYIAGPNLREVLDDNPNGLTDAELDRWWSQSCAGVSHLHRSGLVHRDIKPGNLFDDVGTVKVGDYGLSKFISSSHRGGHTESVGTFHYMAPEVGRGEYGKGVDVYALGIVLYEMLTGRVPFDGESCHEIIVKHMTAQPDLDVIDPRYRDLIKRCLEKDPAKRYADASALLDAWKAIRHGRKQTSVDPRLAPELVAGAPAGVEFTDLGYGPNANPQHNTVHRSESHPQGAGPNQAIYDARLVGHPNADAPVASGPANSPQAFNPTGKPNGEPVARAVRHAAGDFSRWWRTLDRSPGSKAVLIAIAGLVVLVNTHWLLPLLTMLGVMYVPYYIVRNMVLHVKQRPVYEQRQRDSMASMATRPMTRSQWRSSWRHTLRAKPLATRASEWNGSALSSLVGVGVLSAFAAMFSYQSGTLDPVRLAPIAMMATTIATAAVLLLGVGKSWEKDDSDATSRRLAGAGVGAIVGAVAWSMHEFLLLPVDSGLARDIDEFSPPLALYAEDGSATMPTMMAFYAILFGMLRMWRPIDPIRRRRFSVWPVAVTAFAAYLLHQFIPIPQPGGILIAGGISIVTQFAAPWVHPQSPPKIIAPRQESFQVVEDDAVVHV
ncbi:MAG: serine/threonine-protein kinase [Planctomycetota bacterium]